MEERTRLVLIGGFLGAGKTTLINRLAQHYMNEKVPVGVITNDQGEFLVDTEFVRVRGLDVEEVPGGCFCCNFPALVDNAEKLKANKRPEIILAEPVGSCTDLIATVAAPLRKFYGDTFSIAPLIVLVDGPRMMQGEFDKETLGGYLRSHQVAEAEKVVLTKTDSMGPEDIETLIVTISEINPQADVIAYSSVTGHNTDSIIDIIASEEETSRSAVDVDYDIYADAEAELGWYNGIYHFHTERYDGYDLAMKLLNGLFTHGYVGKDIAHAKVTISSQSNHVKVSLVGNEVSIGGVIGSRYGKGDSTLNYNARIVSEPQRLEAAVRDIVDATMAEIADAYTMNMDACFSPGRPNPTHRLL